MDSSHHTEDWKKYYSTLGEFVVNFENIIYDIRNSCCTLLHVQGLEDNYVAEVIFGQKLFTADPLLSCYIAIVNQALKYFNDSASLINELNDFKNKFTEQIANRNNLLHATHFLAEAITITGKPPDEPSRQFKSMKPYPKKTGYSEKWKTEAMVREYIMQLQELREQHLKISKRIKISLKKNKLSR